MVNLKFWERNKKKEKKEELSFKDVFKMFLEQLIAIYYPIELKWWEVLVAVVMGILFGLGVGWMVKHAYITYLPPGKTTTITVTVTPRWPP